MGNDHLFKGAIGEHLASAFLLHFFEAADPDVDIGLDHVGRLRQWSEMPLPAGLGPRSQVEPPVGYRTVTFNFQTKAGTAFRADASTVREWVSTVDKQPVVLLHVRSETYRRQAYRFLVLYEWLMTHPDWYEEAEAGKPQTFSSSEFTLVDEDASNFFTEVLREAARVTGALPHSRWSSLWQTTKTPGLVIDAVALLPMLGHVAACETPSAVYEEAKERRKDELWVTDHVVAFLHEIWLSSKEQRHAARRSPGVRAWWREIRGTATPEATAFERAQFRRFVSAMRDYDRNDRVAFPMPRFRYAEIRVWRVLFQLFPEARRLLTRIFESPNRWPMDQRMGALLIASALANSGNSDLSAAAADLLRRWESELGTHQVLRNYESYALLRQYHFTRAEAEGGEYVGRCIDFIRSHSAIQPEWDFFLNRSYYGDTSNESFRIATARKIVSPRLRDEKTQPITEFFVDQIDRYERRRMTGEHGS